MDTAPPPQMSYLGENLRRLREMHSWTLDDLSTRTQLSKAYLSRLETSERQPSIAALLSLAQAYQRSLADLLTSPSPLPATVVRAQDAPLQPGNGLLHTSLSARGGDFSLRPIRVIVPTQRTGDELYQHDGEEWLYVLSGQLRLILGGDTYLLGLGDAAHFDARIPHRLVAEGGQDTELLLVATSSPRPLLGSYL